MMSIQAPLATAQQMLAITLFAVTIPVLPKIQAPARLTFSFYCDQRKRGSKPSCKSPCMSTSWHLVINWQILLVTRRVPSTQDHMTEVAYISDFALEKQFNAKTLFAHIFSQVLSSDNIF